MNTNRLPLIARCALWMGALFAATTLYAGPAEDLAAADAAIANSDLPTAMALLRKAADQNHSRAQARLADMLRVSEFGPESLGLYRKSAAQGDPAGQFGLGRAYAEGMGVPKDPVQALEWYRKAEAQNYGPALDELGRAHRAGALGLPKDPVLASSYEQRVRALEAAAQQGRK